VKPNPALQRTVTPSACLPSQRFALLSAAELDRWAVATMAGASFQDESMSPDKRIKFAHCVRPTRKGDTPLFAAQAERGALHFGEEIGC
jgi:hypothetical protein